MSESFQLRCCKTASHSLINLINNNSLICPNTQWQNLDIIKKLSINNRSKRSHFQLDIQALEVQADKGLQKTIEINKSPLRIRKWKLIASTRIVGAQLESVSLYLNLTSRGLNMSSQSARECSTLTSSKCNRPNKSGVYWRTSKLWEQLRQPCLGLKCTKWLNCWVGFILDGWKLSISLQAESGSKKIAICRRKLQSTA